MFDPVVLKSKAVTMHRLMLAVTQGYGYWIGGTVPADRAPRLASKFAERYHCDCTTQQRYRRKQKGKANTRLFFYPMPDSIGLFWWLLCTSPTALENGGLENWLDVSTKSGRLVWPDEYELIRLPYTKPLAKKYSESGISRVQGWTWRMQRACFEAWRTRLRKAVATETHGNATLTRQAVYALDTAPGFRGLRAQVWDLRDYYNRCRHASRLPAHDFISAPRWMRARRCRELPLSTLVARLKAGEQSWFS